MAQPVGMMVAVRASLAMAMVAFGVGDLRRGSAGEDAVSGVDESGRGNRWGKGGPYPLPDDADEVVGGDPPL